MEGCHRPLARTAGRVLPLVDSELLLPVATAWAQRGAGALEPFWAQVGTITSAHALVFLSMCYFETQEFSAFPEALKSTSIVSAGPEMDFGLVTAPLLRGFGSRVTCFPASSLSSFSPQLGHTHFWILASPLSLSLQVSKSIQFTEVSALLVCLSSVYPQGWACDVYGAGARRGNLVESLGNTSIGVGMLDVSGPTLEFHVSRSGNRPGTNPVSRPEESQRVVGGVHCVPGFPSPPRSPRVLMPALKTDKHKG